MSERTRSVVALGVIAASLTMIITVLLAGGGGSPDRVHALAARLKCPVCTSESIADSPAQVSRDLYDLITERVDEGWTDDEVVAFFVATYGQEVLLDPPAGGGRAVLWIAPLVALAVGGLVIAGRRAAAPRRISDAERARIEAVLEDDR